ncbi:MAG: response regulator transcription factor [Clostridia bacterium]|nr:response regulator transcription factor [Clostridia bacterium]
MDNQKILVVDDEARMRKLLKDFLSAKGYTILEAENGQKALDVYDMNKDIKLILLDVMMPVLDGWSTLRELRKDSQVPVIILTARGEERDELFGFELGVDEYISKPFSPKILVARVEALLKRCYQDEEALKDIDGIVIDTAAHMVTVDGKNINLSMKEFELLKYLTDNAGIALSREKILNSVWNYDYYGDSRTIDSHIKKLRKKLGKKGDHIETVRGLGYKFEV